MSSRVASGQLGAIAIQIVLKLRLTYQREPLVFLDKLHGSLHLGAELERVELDLQKIVHVLDMGHGGLHHAEPGCVPEEALPGRGLLQAEQNGEPCHFLLKTDGNDVQHFK